MDDLELEQTVQRGTEARQILASSAFTEARDRLMAKYTQGILGSGENDAASRERLYLKLKVLQEVVGELGIVEQHGMKAEHDLKTRKRRRAE